MYPFKSRNTYDRLYPLPSPTAIFELDSKALIDQKLNEFSTQYAHKDFSKTKLPDENPITDMKADTKSPRKKQNKANTMLINKKVQFTEEAKEKNESLTEEEKLWSLLEEKIKSNLKKKDKENPLVRYFKNPLIAAVIESLIVKTIESTFKLKLNLDSSDEIVPPNLIKLFNISPIAISTMSSKTEKLNYVNNCMVKNIDDALDHLMQKAENQEKKILEFTTRFEENKRIGDKNQKDVFEWLQIKTKYEFLKKRLRTSILEKLNYVNIYYIYKFIMIIN